MNSFIYSELSRYDEFRVSFFCRHHNIPKYAEIKIDTGAVYSLVPLKTLGVLKADREELRKLYVDKNMIGGVLHGVEGVFKDILRKEIDNMSRNDKLNQRCFTFWDRFSGVEAGGYALGDRLIRTTCDTDGNILLGMDILKDFDFHIGVSSMTGKHTFIGCMRDAISDEYIKALKDHFGYAPV